MSWQRREGLVTVDTFYSQAGFKSTEFEQTAEHVVPLLTAREQTDTGTKTSGDGSY